MGSPWECVQQDSDGRRDLDADWGVKVAGENRRSWFGYLVHLVVDATYELPLAFEVTTASTAEQPQAQRLQDQLQEHHPQLLVSAVQGWSGAQSSPGRVLVLPARHLTPQDTGRHPDCPLVSPGISHHLQFTARGFTPVD